MKTKLVKPVLVDSEIANIYKCRTGGLGYKEVATSYTVEGQGQQLILISLDPDEKIEEGDICYYENYLGGGKFLVIYTKYGTYHKLNTDLIKQYGTIEGGITPLEQDIFKVIATQDQLSPELIQQLIAEYNNSCMQDFEIEMEEDKSNLCDCYYTKYCKSTQLAPGVKCRDIKHYKPKLNNGFVCIVKKEPITYTEEEVLERLNNLNDLLEEKQYISNINEGVISTSNMSSKEINELNKREEYIQSITNDNFEIDVKKWFEQNKKKWKSTEAINNRESLNSIVSNWGHQTGNWNRDYGRIAETEMNSIFQLGRMNTGLKAHLFSSILYLIPILFVIISVSNISDNVIYLFAFGYILLQIVIGCIAYLEDWYF